MRKEKKVGLDVQIPAELNRRLMNALFWESRRTDFTKNDLVTRAITRELARMESEAGEPYPVIPEGNQVLEGAPDQKS